MPHSSLCVEVPDEYIIAAVQFPPKVKYHPRSEITAESSVIPISHALSRGSRGILDVPQRHPYFILDIKITTNETDGKSIAVRPQSVSGVNAVNPLIVVYDI
jgi:hypothetical protein